MWPVISNNGSATRKAPTVKQHLACIRMLFDWLVTDQVLSSNPAHAVRGPRHWVMKGSTTLMSSEDTSAFWKTIDTSRVVGLRDRALIAALKQTILSDRDQRHVALGIYHKT